MEDTWTFQWMGTGVTTKIGDARLIKQNTTVTLIPAHMNDTYHMPAWEITVTAAPYTAFTTTTSVNAVAQGIYVPDQNYFFPVNLQTAYGVITKQFYLFLTTQGKFMGLFISEEGIAQMPLHERKLLSLYWDNTQVPPNTSFKYVVNGETAQSNWYVITSLADATIALPDNQLQYTSSHNTSGPPKNSTEPNEVLLQRLVNENRQIDDYISLLTSQQLTDVKKIQYQANQTDQLSLAFTILFYGYFVLLFIVGYMIFITNTSWSIVFKIVMAAILISYPFFIVALEYYLVKYGSMVYNYAINQPIGNDPVSRNVKAATTVQRPYDGMVPLAPIS
jgi:hypothetical protein